MITGAMKTKIDTLWTSFWAGGIANPLTVIEQLSYLIFLRLLDMRESLTEKKIQRLGDAELRGKLLYGPDEQHLRWHRFKELGGQEMLDLFRGWPADPEKGIKAEQGVFGHMHRVCLKMSIGEFFKDAQFLISKPDLLVRAVNMISELDLTSDDWKGDIYEHVLAKLTTAGINGQFRTPRHIIDLMVEMVAPQPGDRIADPACGTAGFLVRTIAHIMRQHTSEAGRIEQVDPETGRTDVSYTGDLLTADQRRQIADGIHGFDFDATMLRVSAMNLLLHGLDEPNIHYQDTLAASFDDRHPALVKDAFDVILANPPFKGSLDEQALLPSLKRKVKTTKTELLFLALMVQMLRLGGRCAVVVPNGVQFGSSTAHVAVRRMLVEENQLEAVVNLPSGVFKPYAGVATAILVFTRGGKTEDVFFYDVEADGFSLDDKRQEVKENDIPDVATRWAEWRERKNNKDFADRKSKCFAVSLTDIVKEGYDLSINRYRESNHVAVEYDAPKVILGRLRALQEEIAADIEELGGMLK